MQAVQEILQVLPAVCFAGLMVLGVIAYMIYGSHRHASVQKETAEYQAGAIAQRLGIAVLKGDPGTNLFVNQGSYATQSYDLRLAGQRNGVPIEIVYFKEVWVDRDLLSSTLHRTWQGRLTAHTTASFGHFEVTLRAPDSWNRVRPFFETAMPELATGHPATDARMRVTGDNPAIASALGALLAPLIKLSYLHVIGREGEVTFLMSHSDAGDGCEMIGVGYALYDCETIFDVLASIARTAEGRTA